MPTMRTATVRADSATPVADVVTELDGSVLAMDLSPATGVLAVECRGEIRLLAPRTFDTLRRWRADEAKVRDLAFSADGQRLVTAGYDGAVALWDTTTGTRIRGFTGHEGRTWSVHFSPDTSLIASAGNDGSVRLWRTDRPDHRVLTGHDAPVRSVAFAPDGRHIASGDEAHRIAVWDTASGEPRRWLRGHTGKVRCLRFRPDGTLVSGSSDGTVRIWDITTGLALRRLQAHGVGRVGKIRTMAFSADHEIMVTGGQDRTARVWTSQKMNPHATLSGHDDVVTASALSADHRWVFTSAADHTLRRWPLA